MEAGADLVFVGPASYTTPGALFRKKYISVNKNLGINVYAYLEWENTSRQLTDLKKVTSTTNITKSRKIT